MAENQTKTFQKERLKEITDSIETGIKEMFESDKYKSYLQTMSRFHNYSLNNTMLIAMQKPDATLVAGYNKWKNSFSRNVKKGEKGIKIIAPVPYKVKYDDTSLTIQETAHEVAGGQFLHFPLERTEGISKVDFTEITEKADALESAKIKEIKFEQQESNNIFDLSTLENVITNENSTDFLQSYLDTVVLNSVGTVWENRVEIIIFL